MPNCPHTAEPQEMNILPLHVARAARGTVTVVEVVRLFYENDFRHFIIVCLDVLNQISFQLARTCITIVISLNNSATSSRLPKDVQRHVEVVRYSILG